MNKKVAQVRMSASNQPLDLWNESNKALNTIVSEIKGLFYRQSIPLSEVQRQGGLGVELFPKGSGLQSVPIPQEAYKSKYNSWLDRQKDENATSIAAKDDYSTRLIRIPREAHYAGVATKYLGVPQIGQVQFAGGDQTKKAGYTFRDSTLNESGWITSVATIKVLDSSQFSGQNQIARTRYAGDDPLY